MSISDNQRRIDVDDIKEGLEFVLVNLNTGKTTRGTFLGEPFVNGHEEHVVALRYDDRASGCTVELSCLGLTRSYDGKEYPYLMLLAEESAYE